MTTPATPGALKKYWVDEKCLLEVGKEPIIYNLQGDALVPAIKAADVERLAQILQDALDSFRITQKPEHYPATAWCNQALAILATLKGRTA